MMGLLELREKLRSIYGRYDMYIMPVIKFVFALVTIVMINANIGYMAMLNNIMVEVLLALICALLPNVFTVLILAGVTIANVYALSLEMALITAVLFVVMYLLYFKFTPKASILVMVTVLMFMMKISCVVPVVAGLIYGVYAVVPAAFGVILYYVINLCSTYSTALTSASDTSSQQLSLILDNIMGNEVLLILLAFSVTIVIVGVIKNTSADYAWIYAIIAGTLVDFVILLTGNVIFSTHLSIISIIIGSVLAAVVGYFMWVLIFSADYRRTERVRYEDDDYYYFVKAVPKISVTTSEVKVKRINAQHSKRIPDNSSRTVKKSVEFDDEI